MWCRTNFPDIWTKDDWPGHSPDLSSTENLCAFVQQKLNQMVPNLLDTPLATRVPLGYSMSYPMLGTLLTTWCLPVT